MNKTLKPKCKDFKHGKRTVVSSVANRKSKAPRVSSCKQIFLQSKSVSSFCATDKDITEVIEMDKKPDNFDKISALYGETLKEKEKEL